MMYACYCHYDWFDLGADGKGKSPGRIGFVWTELTLGSTSADCH